MKKVHVLHIMRPELGFFPSPADFQTGDGSGYGDVDGDGMGYGQFHGDSTGDGDGVWDPGLFEAL